MHVEIQRLWKHYGVHEVSFSLEPGQCLAVVGINGAGKSTLLRCMAGLLVPEAGSIEYDQQVFNRLRLDLRKRFMFLPDAPPVAANQPVIEYLHDVLNAYGCWGKQQQHNLVEYFQQFQLSKYLYHPFSELSRGQVYKVALSTLLIIRPELWLLDEPFASGIDPRGMEILRREILTACRQQSTVVFTTQILEIAQTLAPLIAILHRGRLEALGTLDELRQLSNCSGNLFEILQELTTSD